MSKSLIVSSLFGFLLACQSAEESIPTKTEVGLGSSSGAQPAHRGPGPHPHALGQAPGQSGGAVQDPSGFPTFHRTPPPPGPAPGGLGQFTRPVELSTRPRGGYRPQIALGHDDRMHVIFYERAEDGDLIRYRSALPQQAWSAPEPLGFSSGRNWGPDLVVRSDSSVVVVFDKAEEDFRSRGYLTYRRNGQWTSPAPLTQAGAFEIGSGHVAHGEGETLAYVYIGKKLGPEHRFQATGRWLVNNEWQEPVFFSDGTEDAWHTNVERRPDGSMLIGYDVGRGGAETTLYLVDGRAGVFSEPENLSRTGPPGERPHFAFGVDGTDHVTWFHKKGGFPLHVYVRSGQPGAWGEAQEPSKGIGGYHFDPEIEINKDGILCLVWGWDGGEDAEMLYSLNRGSGWEPAQKIADLNWGKPGLSSIQTDSAGRFHVVWNQGVRGENAVYYASIEP